MIVSDAILVVYFATIALLAVYGTHRLALLRRFRWVAERRAACGAASDVPFVTVQLPLFNERTVAERAVRAACALDWPPERLEIQVLDDSTDETRAIVDRVVLAERGRGVGVEAVRRPDRSGFKAGALDHGMQRARGELLCIFDADFVPSPDFLRRLVPRFRDPRIGMVQARWEHRNREESWLTRAQSTLLDGHFVIEHTVRHARGLFFNFNGTAGIWRRAAIDDAGGWEHDTLTEDLDLSYRAQLRGWRFAYEPFVVAPAEVPPDIGAFKSQQHRWAKGSVQVARKLAGRIARADVPMRVKLEAAAHLTGNSGYPLVLLLALLMPLSLLQQERVAGWVHAALFCLCTLSVFLFYDRSQRALGRSPRDRLRDIPAAIVLGIGMCVSQTRAVLEGLSSDPGVFERTPKRGDGALGPSGYRSRLRGLPGAELLLAGWFVWGVVGAIREGLWGTIPFLGLFLSGFAWVGGLSLAAWARPRRPREARETRVTTA